MTSAELIVMTKRRLKDTVPTTTFTGSQSSKIIKDLRRDLPSSVELKAISRPTGVALWGDSMIHYSCKTPDRFSSRIPQPHQDVSLY